jgi:hypothetical protein
MYVIIINNRLYTHIHLRHHMTMLTCGSRDMYLYMYCECALELELELEPARQAVKLTAYATVRFQKPVRSRVTRIVVVRIPYNMDVYYNN